MKPIDSIWYMNRCRGSGAKAYNRREPSSGGNGIILKTKNAIFTSKNSLMTANTVVPSAAPVSRINTAVTAASARFVSGPAIPTRAAPYSSNLTRDGLNGTGFAAKNGGNPDNIRTSGNKTVVKRSLCLSGFNVTLPKSLAVVSPSQWAVMACIAS